MLNKLKKADKGFLKGFLGTFTGVICGVIIGIGTQYVTAWTSPSGVAPTGNVSAPLTTGSATQYKPGILMANDLRADIFYDRNDTGYYLFPRSNSVLNNLHIKNNTNNEWGLLTYGAGWWANSQPQSANASIYTNDAYFRSSGTWASDLASKAYVDSKAGGGNVEVLNVANGGSYGVNHTGLVEITFSGCVHEAGRSIIGYDFSINGSSVHRVGPALVDYQVGWCPSYTYMYNSSGYFTVSALYWGSWVMSNQIIIRKY